MKMKKGKGEQIFNVANIIFMLLLCAITLYPYLNQLAIALNEGMDTSMGGVTIFPRKFTLKNFQSVLSNDSFFNAAWISVSRVILATILSLLIVFSAAYGLTRKGLPGRRGITLFLMIPTYISAGVIPGYLLFRTLHMINSYWIYILPNAFVFYNMVIIRSFLQAIPESLEESAKIDGANDIQIMFKIAMPISKPVIATVALWVSVGNWNDWTTTLMYVTDKRLHPLQYLMMRLIKESEAARDIAMELQMGIKEVASLPTAQSVTAATLIVTTLPIIIVYPLLQKYFVSGVTLGAVKE